MSSLEIRKYYFVFLNDYVTLLYFFLFLSFGPVDSSLLINAFVSIRCDEGFREQVENFLINIQDVCASYH